ncbi:MAG: hypothetical protein ACKOTE_00075, partial [Opitutaceae bacterium]
MATVAVENYLKHVLLLSDSGDELVSMGDLAGAVAVVPGTATAMVKALADEGLLEHQPVFAQHVERDAPAAGGEAHAEA